MNQIRENLHMHRERHDNVTPVYVRPCFATATARIRAMAVLASAKQEGAP